MEKIVNERWGMVLTPTIVEIPKQNIDKFISKIESYGFEPQTDWKGEPFRPEYEGNTFYWLKGNEGIAVLYMDNVYNIEFDEPLTQKQIMESKNMSKKRLKEFDEDMKAQEFLREFGFTPNSLGISFMNGKYSGWDSKSKGNEVGICILCEGDVYDNPEIITMDCLKEMYETYYKDRIKVIITNCGVEIPSTKQFRSAMPEWMKTFKVERFIGNKSIGSYLYESKEKNMGKEIKESGVTGGKLKESAPEIVNPDEQEWVDGVYEFHSVFRDVFIVYADNLQDAIDYLADYVEEKNYSGYIGTYEDYNGNPDRYIQAGNHGIYLDTDIMARTKENGRWLRGWGESKENEKEYKIMKEGKTCSKELKKPHVLQEAQDISFSVVFVTGMGSTTKTIDERTDLRRLYQEVQRELNTNDFWVDDIWANGLNIRGINWMEVVAPGGIINEEFLDRVFDDPEEFALKASFLSDHGYDITEDRLEEVYVYDASGENWVKGNWDVQFPEEWLADTFEQFYPDSKVILENWAYFEDGVAFLFSDDEPNGSAIYDKIDKYFVYTYNV